MPNVTIQVEDAFQADPVNVGGVAMTVASLRTIEATYVNGLLRPLEPIRDSEGQVYFVTILNIETIPRQQAPATDQELARQIPRFPEQRRRIR